VSAVGSEAIEDDLGGLALLVGGAPRRLAPRGRLLGDQRRPAVPPAALDVFVSPMVLHN
jgi:hypothetical protein